MTEGGEGCHGSPKEEHSLREGGGGGAGDVGTVLTGNECKALRGK